MIDWRPVPARLRVQRAYDLAQRAALAAVALAIVTALAAGVAEAVATLFTGA